MVENTHRVLNKNQDINVNWGSWEWPEIFNMIKEVGEVPMEDMRRSFNLGIGMVLIVAPDCVDQLESHLKSLSEDYTIIGEVV